MSGFFESTFAALGIRHFRVLWIGTLFSFVAFFMSTVVQSVVAFDLSGANTAVGWVVFAQGIAMMLLGPLGGALADRWPKRLVVSIGQIISAAVFAGLGIMVATGTIQVLYLALGSLMMGATFAFLGPARQAMVVDLVPEWRRGNAMALTQVANAFSRVVGPALAGLLLAWTLSGATGAFGAMALLYAIAAGSLLLLPASRRRADAHETHVLTDLTDGLRYVWQYRRLRILILFFVSVIMMGYPYVTVLPGLVENEFGRGAEAVSNLYIISAVGALAASLVTARYAESPRASTLYALMGLVFGASLLGLCLSPSFAIAAAMMFGIGIGSGGFQSLNGAVIVRETNPLYFGRVLSLTTIAYAGFGLVGLPVGIAADAFGERATLGAMGAVVCAVVATLSLALSRAPSEVRASTDSAGMTRPGTS